jgi:murein L,D-transpeptidase YcbB/YkuD
MSSYYGVASSRLIGVILTLLLPMVPPQPVLPIAAALERPSVDLVHAQLEGFLPVLQRHYASIGFRPIWTDETDLTARGRALVETLGRAESQGLDPDDYLVDVLASPAGRDNELVAHELLLSAVALRFARDLGWGVTEPSEVDKANTYATRPFDPDAILRALTEDEDPGRTLLALAPSGPGYDALTNALVELRRIRDGGGWGPATPGAVRRLGHTGPRVKELRDELIARGDLPAASDSDVFDLALQNGLIRFQHRHGLEPDGIYGRAVVSELNVPVKTRIQQVRLGLERLRWLPRPLAGRRIAVNLAAFKAYVIEADKVVFATRAVIGKQYYETPMFTGSMTYLVINPYWNVPPSIARAEILPRARRDPGYLARNHMEMDGAIVRQLPGPWNSLGRFKFMFPNPHNVYLHDTPARPLFERAERAFSHGCIRVERPAELAALLLQSQGWTPERIASTVDTGQQTVVPLTTPIPVNISYATAFLDPEDGLLHYRRDIYGRDRKLVEALERRGSGTWEQ